MNILSISKARLFRICAAATAIVTASGDVAQAQLPLGPQDLEIICPPSGGRFLRWQRKEGRTYFIQVSTSEAPLRKWTFLPLIEYGPNAVVSFEITTATPSAFFRLKYTDIPYLPGEIPEESDPDNDGLTTETELIFTHTDPLDNDTDKDGLPDGWEDRNGLDPNDPEGESGCDGDPDHDGVPNSDEYTLGTKPRDQDSDHDGITDGSEIDQETDPNDPNSTPFAEIFILSGDAPEDLAKSRSRTVTVPRGQCRLVAVFVASDEYPEYTDPESESHDEFNDVLTWNVGGNVNLTGSIDVNSRHEEWLISEAAGWSFAGVEAAHLEEYRVIQAPENADISIPISLSATNIGDGMVASTVITALLPISFRITHTEHERDVEGNELPAVVAPGPDTLLRDEIANLRVALPLMEFLSWDTTLDVDTGDMMTSTLGERGNVKMYDIGKIENEVTVPLTVSASGTTVSGPYTFDPPEPSAPDNLRIVLNKEGTFRLRLRTGDDTINVTSQEFTVSKRIRKYARLPEINDADFDRFDIAFESAATYWGAYYEHPVDADVLKSIGFQESTLGYGDDPVDIMTIGNVDDGCLLVLRGNPGHTEKEAIPAAIGGMEVRIMDYDDADESPAATAIHWGTCWLFHKAQKGRFEADSGNPPYYVRFTGWNPWDTAIGYYGPNPVYLGVIEGPWKRGRKDSTTGKVNDEWVKIDFPVNQYKYLWPILTNSRSRK